jgi:hypothetical protein
MYRRLKHSILFFLLASLAWLCPLQAQTDPNPDGPPPNFTASPDPVPDDPGSDVDPSVVDLGPTNLGEPVEVYIGDPQFLGDPGGGDSLDVVPGDGSGDQTSSYGASLPPLDCTTFNDPAGVNPIGVSPDSNHHYFWYKNAPLVLIGASADDGCALQPPNPQSSSTQCNNGNYMSVIDSAFANNLNKIRLWVVLPGDVVRGDVPFKWTVPTSGASYWSLDTVNQSYFNRVAAVVNYARQKNIVFVEVTFFSPFQGAYVSSGSWMNTGTHMSKATVNNALSDVGFSDPRYFVLLNGRSSDTNIPASQQLMSAYQKKVIDWTVDALWCFDNVYWEIANEPDGGWNTLGVDPGYVADWEKQMIAEVRAHEATHHLLNHGHLIAVQPFTRQGAVALLPPSGPPPAQPLSLPAQIMNGHYTTVAVPFRANLPFGSSGLDLGAISLLQTYYQKPMIFGFNETKITSGGVGGNFGTKSHQNGVASSGTLEPVRAEALEFLFSQGATYDHYGYLLNNVAPTPVRQQLGQARLFFNPPPPAPNTDGTQLGAFGITPLKLTDFKGMSLDATRPNSTWASWFQPGAYPSAWETSTSSKRYWAALETNTSVAPRALLYYVHHSTPRCKGSPDYGAGGCAGGSLQNLGFGGYDARVWTSSLMYQESIPLTLGSFTGTYDVTWIDPSTMLPLSGGTSATPSHLTTTWNGSTCSGLTNCRITSPKYSFDVILRIYHY